MVQLLDNHVTNLLVRSGFKSDTYLCFLDVSLVSFMGASVIQLVAHWITDHYHVSLNLGVGISEQCFIFDFASLPLEVTRPI